MTKAYLSGITQALLTDFLESRRNQCSLLQIGANDGRTADFINYKVRGHNWFSIFVEPHPQYFSQLKLAYADCNRCFFVNCAIGKEVCEAKDLYYVKTLPDESSFLKGIASFNKEHLVKHGIAQENIASQPVPMMTLQQLVDQYMLYDVDILVVDTEGWELDVLESVSFETFWPKLIIFEYCHLDDEKFNKILEHVGGAYHACKAEFDAFLIRRKV